MRHTRFLAACLLVAIGLQTVAMHAAEQAEPVYANAVVAADHRLASEAGLEMLKKGGNVVDAAVATGFALSVVRPASSGIGGGGFMVIWNASKQEATALDYREQGPAKATRDMYVDPKDPAKARTDLSQHGHLAVAIPGHVAGLCLALKNHGTLDLKTVLGPAIRLCREGVPVDPHDLGVQKSVLKQFQDHPEYHERFATLHKLYLNNGQPWKIGDRFHSPLERVLERIAADGPDGFYRGPVGEAIAAEMQRGNGLMTLHDLTTVKPMVRQPLTSPLGNRTLHTMPPPSSGGIALIETLNILAAAEARNREEHVPTVAHNSPRYLHLLAESFKHAFADRAEFLGDADFVKVPVARLVSPTNASRLAERVHLDHTLPAQEYGRFVLPDDAGTTHFSILDAKGNAVACTETVNTAYGSFVVEPTFGIILNNEMEDFTAHPGVPNVFGLIQSPNNAVEPGKRPLSSMTPSIVVRDGKAQFVAGASGGPRIITATTQVLINMTRFGMTPAQAVNAPRIHHQWMPEELLVEKAMPDEIGDALRKTGHKTKPTNESAVVQAASRSADGLRAASDPRKHGKAAGF